MSGVKRLAQQENKGQGQVTNEDLEKFGNAEKSKETSEE